VSDPHKTQTQCTVDGCDKPMLAHGWCAAHYNRWRRHGSPTAGRTNVGRPLDFFRNVVIGPSQDECLLWPYGKNSAGYGRLTLNGNKRLVHRMACEHVHGPAPSESHEAAHNCGVRACCNPRHMRWATPRENAADRVLHGTDNRGERHANSKLTEAMVRTIRGAAGTVPAREAAALAGVSLSAVTAIQRWLDA